MGVLLSFGCPTAWAQMPEGFGQRDLFTGNPGVASYNSTQNSFTLSNSQGNFLDRAQFVYVELEGDFEFVVRLVSIVDSGVPGNSSNVGIMLRESLSGAGTVRASGATIKGDTHKFSAWSRRSVPTINPWSANQAKVQLPIWMKIVRKGDKVCSYRSEDGNWWRVVEAWNHGSQENLNETLYVGMAIGAGGAGVTRTATFDSISYGPVTTSQFDVQTSWIGNSFEGGGGGHVPRMFTSMVVDRTTGEIYADSQHDEGKMKGVAYSTATGRPRFVSREHWDRSGRAVTFSGSHLYMATVRTLSGQTVYGIARYHKANGNTANIPNPNTGSGSAAWVRQVATTAEIEGLVFNPVDNKLYVSDTGNQRVLIYGVDLNLLGEFSTAGRSPHKMTVDAAGHLWIVFPEEDSQPAVVKKYNTGGSTLGPQITGLVSPAGVSVHPGGNIWVCENGPLQRIQIYNATGGSSPVDTFGVNNGILANSPTLKGRPHPTKFNGPVAVDFDLAGNIYVACSGLPFFGIEHGELKKFNAARNLIWERSGLDWMTSADPDRAVAGTDVYTYSHRMELDYSKPTGQEWSYAGYTVDPYSYPDDPRLHQWMVHAWIRRVGPGNEKILFVGRDGGQCVAWYRFEAGSEIAIPAGMFSSRPLTSQKIAGPVWPDHAPASGSWIWRDDNGNGAMDPGEFYPAGNGVTGFQNINISEDGDIWCFTGLTAPLRRYRLTGVSNGIPTYNTAPELRTKPAVLTEWSRMLYEPDTDTMYLGGYSPAYPKTPAANGDWPWAQFGRVLMKFSNWSAAPSTPDWVKPLPYDVNGGFTGSNHQRDIATNIAEAGDYLFVTMSAFGDVLALRKSDAEIVDRFVPGPEVGGQTGIVDITQGTNAFRRANGEYIIFVEENWQNKVMMYRWNPDSESGGELQVLPVVAATASGFASPHTPGRAFDGNLGTRWTVLGNGSWVQGDLGQQATVHEVDIAFYVGEQRSYYFNLETSIDGATWTPVWGSTQASSGTSLQREKFVLPTPAVARYIRFVGYGSSANAWNALTDIVIHGQVNGGQAVVPAFSLQPTSVTVYEGQSATFNVQVTGSPVPALQWQQQVSGTWQNIAGATALSLPLSGVGAAQSGSYRVTATNAAGSVISATATLSVHLDQGLPGLTGSAMGSGTTFVSRVVAGDVWEQATDAKGVNGDGSGSDSLLFDFETRTGDFQTVVNVGALSGPSTARAGLMLREGNAPGARMVMIASVTGNTYVHRGRTTSGSSGTSETVAQAGGSTIQHAFPDKWVMIERAGDLVLVMTSHDDIHYTLVHSYTLAALQSSIEIGVFSMSGALGQVAVAQFDGFTIIGGSALEAHPVVAATASGFASPHTPERAFDGNLATRWTVLGNGSWVQGDLGEVITIHEVNIAFHVGDQRSYYFNLETSTDGSTWTPVWGSTQSSSGTTLQHETLVLPAPVTARYVRLVGYGNSSNGWNAVTDIAVYTQGSAPPSGVTELPVVAATASGFTSPHVPELAFDGNLATRWTVAGLGAWVQGDLGGAFTVHEVDVAFYVGDQRSYYFNLETSMDGSSWTPVWGSTQSSSGTTLQHETLVLPAPVTARYVRLVGYGNSSNGWNAVTDIVIYGN